MERKWAETAKKIIISRRASILTGRLLLDA